MGRITSPCLMNVWGIPTTQNSTVAAYIEKNDEKRKHVFILKTRT